MEKLGFANRIEVWREIWAEVLEEHRIMAGLEIASGYNVASVYSKPPSIPLFQVSELARLRRGKHKVPPL